MHLGVRVVMIKSKRERFGKEKPFFTVFVYRKSNESRRYVQDTHFGVGIAGL